ncbi:threonine/serine ThrE exporter family protein [Lacticaseibacillus zhaodongensis]|uniref:threonine/serine ThrE exporter family protein n=1 Tax=Lacticaseibacillus zhaodongensis TaxID=2668065 RepID=UPI0012D33BC5|nr:threonine/serine exporter family protein [Lacticaseibacillus zhaodongensis]
MNSTQEKDIIDLCGLVGKILLENGAETGRVEGTVEYIGKAAGVDVSCHAAMTAIFVDSNTDPTTHLVKVRTGDFDLRKVDAINTLSREFTAGKIDYAQLKHSVHRVNARRQDYSWPVKIFGAGLVSVAPMLAFHATWSDLAWAAPVGIIGYLAAQWTGHVNKVPYIAVGVGGLVIGLLASFLQACGLGNSANEIVVSALMPLVPGVAITNSLRELIARHTISGLVRVVDAIMTAGAIGAGVVLGSIFGRLLGGGF